LIAGDAGVVASLLDGIPAAINVRLIAGDAGVVGSLLDGTPAAISVRVIAGDAGVVTSALASEAATAAPRPIAGDAGVVTSLLDADAGLSSPGDDGRAPGVEMRTCSGFDEIVGPERSSGPRSATGVAATVGPLTSDVACAGFAGASFNAREPSGEVERVPVGGVAVGFAGATGVPRAGVAGPGVRSCSAEPQASVAARAGAERARGTVAGTPEDGVLVADTAAVAVCWMFCA
jgi:hypothetical protein